MYSPTRSRKTGVADRMPDSGSGSRRLRGARSILPTEYRADLVVLLVDGKPVLGIIVEVQLSEDLDKRVSWPAYIVNLFARIRCPVELLVVSPSSSVAAWASKPIQIGASTIRPRVVGPDGVPVIRSVDAASLSPELAVLSALAHGQDEVDTAVAVALAASAAARDTRGLARQGRHRVENH